MASQNNANEDNLFLDCRKVENLSQCQDILLEIFNDIGSHDVTLISDVDGERLTAHRKVLSSVSEYFSILLNKPMQSNLEDIIIAQVCGATLESLIKYCYSGQIEITWQNATDLFVAASHLRFHHVRHECIQFYKQQMEVKPELCIDIYIMAEKYMAHDLMKNAVQTVVRNFTTVSKSPVFNRMGWIFLEQLLHSNDRFEITEEKIFEVAMDWVNFRRECRKGLIPEILKLIRIAEFDITYLRKNVRPVCGSSESLSLLTDALFCKMSPQENQFGFLNGQHTTKRMLSNKLMVVGGNFDVNDITIETYCSETDTWKLSNKTIPLSNKFKQYTLIGENLYINASLRNEVFCINLSTFSVSFLPPMNTDRASYGLVALNNQLYVIGGLSVRDPHGPLKSVECYDPRTEEWKECDPMPFVRTDFTATVLKGCIYVIGGDFNVERYNPVENIWVSMAPMNQGRTNPSVATSNDKIYVLGGEIYNSFYSAMLRSITVECYDPEMNNWTAIASVHGDGISVTAAVYLNELYVFGGWDCEGKGLNSVRKYDSSAGKWEAVKPMNKIRCDFAAIVLNN